MPPGIHVTFCRHFHSCEKNKWNSPIVALILWYDWPRNCSGYLPGSTPVLVDFLDSTKPGVQSGHEPSNWSPCFCSCSHNNFSTQQPAWTLKTWFQSCHFLAQNPPLASCNRCSGALPKHPSPGPKHLFPQMLEQLTALSRVSLYEFCWEDLPQWRSLAWQPATTNAWCRRTKPALYWPFQLLSSQRHRLHHSSVSPSAKFSFFHRYVDMDA